MGDADFHPRWSAGAYEKSGRFVSQLAGGVVDLLAPVPGENILDLGCGDGVLTLKISEKGARVIGVDSSPELVQAALKRSVEARLCDAEQLTFLAEFDAVFSNAALHWMLEQDRVLTGVRRALKPKGRFIGELGGHGNIASIRAALQSVMADFDVDAEAAAHNVFFTAEEYSKLLETHGFRIDFLKIIHRPTLLPDGIDGWLRTFRTSLLDGLSAQHQQQVIQRVSGILAPILRTKSGQWYADYVRLRFRAYVV